MAPAMMMQKINYWPGAFPVIGSVPMALLNKRMCGSGLLKCDYIVRNFRYTKGSIAHL